MGRVKRVIHAHAHKRRETDDLSEKSHCRTEVRKPISVATVRPTVRVVSKPIGKFCGKTSTTAMTMLREVTVEPKVVLISSTCIATSADFEEWSRYRRSGHGVIALISSALAGQ